MTDVRWEAVEPRQLTGTGFMYHGYVRRGADGPLEECGHDHRSIDTARRCVERIAALRNEKRATSDSEEALSGVARDLRTSVEALALAWESEASEDAESRDDGIALLAIESCAKALRAALAEASAVESRPHTARLRAALAATEAPARLVSKEDAAKVYRDELSDIAEGDAKR